MSRLQAAAVAVVLATLAGCGSGGNYVPVSGVVTYNGEPLKGVQVMFQPMATTGMDTGGVGSFAMTDDNGRYTLEASTPSPTKGALVGKHRVRIAFPPKAGEAPDNESDVVVPAVKGGSKLPAQPIPAKYNSESKLEFEVPAAGTKDADFKLDGPPLPKSNAK